MLRCLLISIIIMTSLTTGRAQDPVFSQFYASGLHLNPALCGLGSDVVVGLNYRTQWGAIDLPYRTFQFTAIHPIVRQGINAKNMGGFGVNLFSDEAGDNRQFVAQGLSLASSYNFHLNRSGKHIIATALQFGVIQRQVNFNGLQWSTQYSQVLGYDPTLPGEYFGTERITTPVINAGIMWRLVDDTHFAPLKMYYHGFAVSNLNRPQAFTHDANDAQALLLKLHGGYLHTLNNGLELSPNYLIQHQRETQINIGGYAAYPLPDVTSRYIDDLKVSFGMWYRIRDSFIFTTGASTSTWTVGLSYDLNTSSLSRYFPGASAFEVSFSYRIKTLQQKLPRFSTPLI